MLLNFAADNCLQFSNVCLHYFLLHFLCQPAGFQATRFTVIDRSFSIASPLPLIRAKHTWSMVVVTLSSCRRLSRWWSLLRRRKRRETEPCRCYWGEVLTSTLEMTLGWPSVLTPANCAAMTSFGFSSGTMSILTFQTIAVSYLHSPLLLKRVEDHWWSIAISMLG